MSEAQEFIQLGNLADIIMGQSPDSASCNTDEHGLPFLQGCAEFGKQSPSTEFYCFPPLRISKPDSILISVRAPVGRLNWGEQSYCIGRGLGAIKARSGLSDTRFLGYSIEQNVSFLHRRSQGSTFLAIGTNDIKIFPIPAISYKKQRKISSILDTIDHTITHTETLIQKYQQIKAGLMHDLFTRGIGADGKLRPPRDEAPELYQESAIDWIPKEWDVKKLVELAHFQRGHDIVESNFIEGNYPVISSGGVIGLHNEFTSKGPSVVLGRKGTIGKVHYVNSNFWAHDTSLFATDLFDNEPLFIYCLCNYLNLAKYGTKSGSPSLNRNDIHPLIVGRPSPIEQKIIVTRLNACGDKISSLSGEYTKLRCVKSGLMHDLLTGKVPVNVDAAEVACD